MLLALAGYHPLNPFLRAQQKRAGVTPKKPHGRTPVVKV